MSKVDVQKIPVLPALCAKCTDYAVAQAASRRSGIVFCSHSPNTPGAGVMAIVQQRGGRLVAFNSLWPKSRDEATAMMDAVEEVVTTKLNQDPPTNH